MQIACVLKSGREFWPEHVSNLADSILEHNDLPILCLTDQVIDHPAVKVVPLQHDWPKWWAKIELFRPGVCPGPTLYLDLDTAVVGKIPPITDKFTMLRDVYQGTNYGSGVMSWQECPTRIYDAFVRDPQGHQIRYSTRVNWGDQGFIRDHVGVTPEVFGPEYRSYKVHCQSQVPEGTKVVFFHGKPRPWQVNLRF